MGKINIFILDCIEEINNHSLEYSFDEKTLVNDLYKHICDLFPGKILSDEKDYKKSFSFMVDGKFIHAYTDYSLEKFLDNWGIDKDNVIIKCNMAFGIGAGFAVKELAKIRINPDEGKHKNLPHVHIVKINQSKPQYRISLKDFKQLDSDEDKWENAFGKKQRKKIMGILKDNKETLIDYYERIQKGEYIMDRILIFVDGKSVEFK